MASHSEGEPDPHYCDHPPGGDPGRGCPNWPGCFSVAASPITPRGSVYRASTTPVALTAALEATADEPDEDDTPGIAVLLASLLGVIAGGALALVIGLVIAWYLIGWTLQL